MGLSAPLTDERVGAKQAVIPVRDVPDEQSLLAQPTSGRLRLLSRPRGVPMDQPAGMCIWFTGQSGGGKTTITNALVPRLEEMGRTVSVLDVVPLLRKRWWEKTSEGKLLRKAYVASQIVHHGGVAIAVTVSARASVRDQARQMIGRNHFVEVLVAPPPEVAEARKAARKKKPKLGKRLRRMARRALSGLLGRNQRERGPSRPPDVEIDSSVVPADQAAEMIIAHLGERGLISSPTPRG